ncbi:hypothetical protein TELCIR_18957 [Teladorsagia circumcincta]|uniref:Serine-threonine/tyrosine-protein kinase catalytic domain-containing protein n=1 Tax=Teladorsagia circumcincta TaxID=45464 RepID=A0A2G9TNV8_TELCI|nr:hypothetical protein TELCIR_18957 [Teladorsagia circumcincta]
MQERIESRRTSRVTEETLLRLEERSSLSSSDYSGQIIPFIELGTIRIHECIGKGAFGEVYCGSWEKTGERTVAIKSMKADEDVEKERKETLSINQIRDVPQLCMAFQLRYDRATALLAVAPLYIASSKYEHIRLILPSKKIVVEVSKRRFLPRQELLKDVQSCGCDFGFPH